MPSPAEPPPAPELQPVGVRYEHTRGLPALLEQLELSVLLSTYQAMGLCRTSSGIAVGTCEHDIAYLARSCHHSGLLMGHDMAWGCERLWDSLSHSPRTEVLLESGPRNPGCWLETGLRRAGVIRALARIRSSLDKVPSWLPPPPATTG